MPVEGLVFDGLDLQSGVYSLTAIDLTPPRKKPEWADGTDGDGSLLVRDPLFENRTINATVEVRAASRNAGQDAVGLIIDKLEEADKNQAGIPLVWTPASSTEILTFYVLTGEITDFPMTWEAAYWADPPLLTVGLSLTCKPFGYENEVAGPSTSASAPVVILSVPAIPGDVPAEARLVVTDTATQSRDFVAWGLEHFHQAGADLLLTTPDMTITGFAGASTTRAGSVSTNIFRGTLTTVPVAMCGTGNEAHVGSYRVFARYWATGLGCRLRLAWREGDGPFSYNLFAVPPAEDAWCESDLGLISVPVPPLGTQRWTGQIEAYSDVPGDTLDIDYLVMMPVELFGKARRPQGYATSLAFSARDEFDQSAGALAGKTAPTGGVWAGAGDADDFAVEITGKTAQRTAVSDADVNTGRYAVSGVAAFAAQVVQVDVKHNLSGIAAGIQERGVLARYVDTSNWLHAVTRSPSGGKFEVKKRVAGTVTELFSTDAIPFQPANAWYTLRIAIDTAGRWAVWYFQAGTGANASPVAQGQDAVLATGGALDDGKPGFYDVNTGATAITRNFDNFSAFVPVADAACWASQSIEFRSDQTLREDSSGTYWGPPNTYRGAPFFLPAAGDENRTTRVAVMARRNDIELLPEANVSDATSVAVTYTPRRLNVPRS